jgi:hypothetical protein
MIHFLNYKKLTQEENPATIKINDYVNIVPKLKNKLFLQYFEILFLAAIGSPLFNHNILQFPEANVVSFKSTSGVFSSLPRLVSSQTLR